MTQNPEYLKGIIDYIITEPEEGDDDGAFDFAELFWLASALDASAGRSNEKREFELKLFRISSSLSTPMIKLFLSPPSEKITLEIPF